MKIRDILAKNEPTLSFEVFPPKTEDKYESVEMAASEIAKLNPAFMSVTYGAGGGRSVAFSSISSAWSVILQQLSCRLKSITSFSPSRRWSERSMTFSASQSSSTPNCSPLITMPRRFSQRWCVFVSTTRR